MSQRATTTTVYFADFVRQHVSARHAKAVLSAKKPADRLWREFIRHVVVPAGDHAEEVVVDISSNGLHFVRTITLPFKDKA